jgi:hypothetical protein
VEACGGVDLTLRELYQNLFVYAFGCVVAGLVEAVNASFVGGDVVG